MISPEIMEALAVKLEPPKLNFLATYLKSQGRMTVEGVARETGWSVASGHRILREARTMVGQENLPRAKELRRVAIQAILDQDKAMQFITDQVGCSSATVYRAKRELDL